MDETVKKTGVDTREYRDREIVRDRSVPKSYPGRWSVDGVEFKTLKEAVRYIDRHN